MNSIFLGSKDIKRRKGKSLHSRRFYFCRSPYVLKKLSDQDECMMAHTGGIMYCGGKKAMITEDSFQIPRTELKSLSVGRHQEMLIEEI